MFGNIDRTNTDQSTTTAINSIHQNSIKLAFFPLKIKMRLNSKKYFKLQFQRQINIYKDDANGKVSQFSTCGLDGQVVIWDLNVRIII